MLVVASQFLQIVGGWIVRWYYKGAEYPYFSNLPGWGVGLYNLLITFLSLLAPLMFLLFLRDAVGLRLPIGVSAISVGILLPLFLGVSVAVNSVFSMLQTWVTSALNIVVEPAAILPIGFWERFFYFFTTCIVAALLEELLFRGAIQGLLGVWGPRFAIVATSLLFMLVHSSFWELPTVFILSVMLGYITEISRSIWPAILLHSANNFCSGIMLLVKETKSGISALAFVFWFTLLLVAMFAGAVWAVKYFKILPKFKLSKDNPLLKKNGVRFFRLFKAPFFTLGFVTIVINFIVRIFVL